MDKEVKKYIEKQEPQQQQIIKKVRGLILETLADCDEKTAWGAVVFAGSKFYIAALKNKVHVGFAINGLSKEEISLFEGSGKTMRHIKIYSLADIDEKKLVKLIKMVDEKVVCNSC
ncbi:DUF5655 domain-containing protein [Chloroflexota bacterium]